MFAKLVNLNRALALRTTVHLFLCIGFVSAVAFILSAHWLLILAALPVCAFAWFVLYHFEKGIALWGGSTTALEPAKANTRNGTGAASDNSAMRGVPAKEPVPVSLDAPAFLSGLGTETVAEFDARERSYQNQRTIGAKWREPVTVAWPELLK